MQISGTTPVYGVWGHPISHSASPAMHNAALGALDLPGVYVAFDVAPESVAEAVAGVRALGIRGVNVTVPLKEQVGAHLDGLTGRAARLGAVNTLLWEDDKLLGDSTDGPGFLAALAQDGFSVSERTQAVVLGAGGSGRAVVAALVEAGANVVVLNRTRERAAEVATQFGARHAPWGEATLRLLLPDADLLVNTTSVGRSGVDAQLPVPRELPAHLFVSDLNYSRIEPPLLTLARARGCRTQDGLELLVQQGALSFARWTGVAPPLDIMRAAVLATLAKQG